MSRLFAKVSLLSTVLACFLLLVSHHDDLFGQTSGRISIPTTRLTIVPPAGYTLLPSRPILFADPVKPIMTFAETNDSLASIMERYSDPTSLAEHNFEPLNQPEKFSIDGLPGMRYNLRQHTGLLSTVTLIHRIFIAGDSLGTFIVIISYQDTIPAEKASPLIASIATIHRDKSHPLSPGELLGFSFMPPAGFSLTGSDANNELYTPITVMKSDSTNITALILTTSNGPGTYEHFVDDPRSRIMEGTISNASMGIVVSKVIEYDTLILDGVFSLESVSTGIASQTGQDVLIYLTTLFFPGHIIVFKGFAKATPESEYIETYKKSIRTFRRSHFPPDSIPGCSTLLARATASEALDCYNKFLECNPGSIAARLGKAEALHLAGNDKRAVVEYSEILEKQQFCEEALLGRSQSYRKLGEPSRSIDDLNIALELNCKNITALLERADIRVAEHSSTWARADYRKAIALRPDSADLLVALGDLEPDSEAFRLYERAIVLDNHSTAAFKERGLRHMFRREYNEAIADFTHAIAQRPNDKELHGYRGEAYQLIYKLDAALQDMAKGPDDAKFLGSRGYVNGLMNHYEQALKDFERSRHLDTSAWMPLFLRGIVHYLNGASRDAIADFRKAAAKSQSAEVRAWLYFSEIPVYGLAHAHENLKKYFDTGASETEDWNMILSFLLGKMTEQQLVHSLKAYQERGEMYSEHERLEEARCDMNFAIGMDYSISGKSSEALSSWKKCLTFYRTTLISRSSAEALVRWAFNKNKH